MLRVGFKQPNEKVLCSPNLSEETHINCSELLLSRSLETMTNVGVWMSDSSWLTWLSIKKYLPSFKFLVRFPLHKRISVSPADLVNLFLFGTNVILGKYHSVFFLWGRRLQIYHLHFFIHFIQHAVYFLLIHSILYISASVTWMKDLIPQNSPENKW